MKLALNERKLKHALTKGSRWEITNYRFPQKNEGQIVTRVGEDRLCDVVGVNDEGLSLFDEHGRTSHMSWPWYESLQVWFSNDSWYIGKENLSLETPGLPPHREAYLELHPYLWESAGDLEEVTITGPHHDSNSPFGPGSVTLRREEWCIASKRNLINFGDIQVPILCRVTHFDNWEDADKFLLKLYDERSRYIFGWEKVVRTARIWMTEYAKQCMKR